MDGCLDGLVNRVIWVSESFKECKDLDFEKNTWWKHYRWAEDGWLATDGSELFSAACDALKILIKALVGSLL